MTLGLIQSLFYICFALVVGVRFEAGVGGAPCSFVLATTIAAAFGCSAPSWRCAPAPANRSRRCSRCSSSSCSSARSRARNLIAEDWFKIATINPVSYLIEGVRSLFIIGWDFDALARAFGVAIALVTVSIVLASRALGRTDGAHVNPAESRSSALGIAWRRVHNAFTKPAILLPSLIFPLFFLAAFAGGLSAVSNTPELQLPRGYTTFGFGFVLLQSSALGGVFTGFSIAADFQFGMGRRMLLATRYRTSIVVGYAITAAVLRVLVTWTW